MSARRRLSDQEQAAQFGLFDSTLVLRKPERASELPKTAREIVGVIGLPATIDLVKAFGGDELDCTHIAVGGRSRLWEMLVEVVGPDAAAKLVSHFKGARFYVPNCKAALAKERHRSIVAAFDGGEPFDAIRRRTGLSRSYLFRVLKMPLSS